LPQERTNKGAKNIKQVVEGGVQGHKIKQRNWLLKKAVRRENFDVLAVEAEVGKMTTRAVTQAIRDPSRYSTI